MFKLQVTDPAALGVAAVSSSAAAAASQVAIEWVGVPLPVVLAAIAGACFARSFLEPLGFGRAFWRVFGWVAFSCFIAPLARALVNHFAGFELPTNAMAGIAVWVATAEAWPLLIAFLRREFPALTERWLGKKDKGGSDV